MAVGVVQVAPDSTGKFLRTRTRTEGANTVHEQIVATRSTNRDTIASGWVSGFRTPARAATTQILFTLLNGGTNVVALRRLNAEVDTIVAKAVASPFLRLMRISAVTASTGTTLTIGVSDTAATALSSSIVATGDASADGTNSGTALAATTTGAALWQQLVPRLHTAVGLWNPESMPMMPDDGGFINDSPLLLRNGQGVAVIANSPAAPTAGDWVYAIKAVFDEVTLPY